MPIGVPRIIYCWGEELPAQWTDIYNFIFRRRMVFLMQYLDDELCNQICGLLINIHMEDRSKELEKKEMEKSGLFKTASGASKPTNTSSITTTQKKNVTESTAAVFKEAASFSDSTAKKGNQKYIEDLLISQQDLAIQQNYTLEQYTLQKITMQWLTWNAQFFNYEDEPYVYYLAEILSKDFKKQNASLLYTLQITRLMKMFKNFSNLSNKLTYKIKMRLNSSALTLQKKPRACFSEGPSQNQNQNQNQNQKGFLKSNLRQTKNSFSENSTTLLPISKKPVGVGKKQSSTQKASSSQKKKHFHMYSPFRLIANFASQKYSLNQLNACWGFNILSEKDPNLSKTYVASFSSDSMASEKKPFLNKTQSELKTLLSKKNFSSFYQNQNHKLNICENSLAERLLKAEYTRDRISSNVTTKNNVFLSKSFLRQKTAGFEKPDLSFLDLDLEKNNGYKSKNSLYANQVNNTLGNKKKQSDGVPADCFGPEGKKKGQWPSENDGVPLDFAIQKKKAVLNANPTKSMVNKTSRTKLASNYLDFQNFDNFDSFYRKQTERNLQEEESKKVFVIINSFGGSVGNGITVHDALQFIKAGSLTLALGVAASAASLALAGGTIGERYVTEGCHVMIHQPEGGLNGQASDIWIDSQEIMKIRLDVAEIYSLCTYRPRHKILRDLDRDFYLTAMETIYYGLADEIATNEVMHQIIEMTSKVWDFHDTKQQRLLESRESASAAMDTQTQS